MDIPRRDNRTRKLTRRVGYIGAVVVVVAAVTFGLRPSQAFSTPVVDRAGLWVDTVKRSSMIRDVRGAGTLVPERIWWVPASSDGRVEKVLTLPGTPVQADTVLVELSNPQLTRDMADAEWEVRSLQAEYALLEVQIESRQLDLEVAIARAAADFTEAELRAAVDEDLVKDGLVSELAHKLSRVRADENAKVMAVERQRLGIRVSAAQAERGAAQARLERAKALLDLRRQQVESLRVRAGIDGVLEQMDVEVGQRVLPGATIAKVSDPSKLKAVIQIGQAQAGEVSAGQMVTIDTRSGVVAGRVVRLNPAVEQGTVAVDVAIEGALPRGTRPRMTVDGTIELERLEHVLSVGRPVFAQAGAVIGLFRVSPDGKVVSRVQVQVGRLSVTMAEIVGGLEEGDHVVLSDMKQWDAHESLRLQ